jgi:hypothetical protein
MPKKNSNEFPHLNTPRNTLHHYFSFLKDYDIFKIDVSNNFNFERHDWKRNKTHHSKALGSYIGGLITIAIQIFFLYYCIFLIVQMESGDIDLIKETVVSNPIGEEGGKNDIKLKDYVFMPIVEIQEKSQFSIIRQLDIFEGEPDDKVLDL